MILSKACRAKTFKLSSPTAHPLTHSTIRKYTASPSPSPSYAHKTILITGGSGAIGLSCASYFHSLGASIHLLGRSSTKLEAAKSHILSTTASTHSPQDPTSQNPAVQPPSPANASAESRIVLVPGDITDVTLWESLPQSFTSGLDVLINAAGITQNRALRLASTDHLWDVVDTNLIGTMLACKYLSKKMAGSRKAMVGSEERRGGVIVNVGSLLGERGGRGAVAYAASKAGIVGLTRALADEFASSGIRVNAVVPGYIRSEMTQALPQEHLTKMIPLRRFGEPSEVADAVAFLVANQYANNCVLNLDGGLSATMG